MLLLHETDCRRRQAIAANGPIRRAIPLALNNFAPPCNIVKLGSWRDDWPQPGLTQCRAARGAEGGILGRLWHGRMFAG